MRATLSLYFAVATLVAGLAGCGSTSTLPPMDMAVPADLRVGPDMAVVRCCGMPGDKGNSLGVGKYCPEISDCMGNGKATICASLGGDPRYAFCLFICDPKADGGNPCGENAQCACKDANCACTPDSCVKITPPGC